MPTAADWIDHYKQASEHEKERIDALIREDRRDTPWRPLRDLEDAHSLTPQQRAQQSEADFLFYGGAAGGGKTDLLVGLALTEHTRSIIFRREAKQLRAINDRIAQIRNSRDGFSSQQGRWKLSKDKLIDLGGVKDLGDEEAYQGQPHDLIGFDELPQFLESQFRFLTGWNRTTDPNQRCRVVGAGNPPTSAEGEWVIQFWGPWLDPQHKNPAIPGELRWYAALDGEDIAVEDGKEFEHKGELIQPKSRTFIPSSVDDNPFLVSTNYRAMLQSLPEPLRSQMLRGDFSAGRDDDPWQIIPTEWVRMAQDRWKLSKPHGPMSNMGCDVARGGQDQTVLTARYSNWFAPQIIKQGSETPNGQAVAGLTVSYLRNDASVYVDIIGVGASAFDQMKMAGINVVAANASEASHATDRSGRLLFVNKRAEWWWKMREALDPHYGEEIALPPERDLFVDLVAPRWKMTSRGVQVESKEDIVKRIGRSTDHGDSVVLANAEQVVRQRDYAYADTEEESYG